MKKSTSKPKGSTFDAAFAALTALARSNETSAKAGVMAAVAGVSACGKARIELLQAIREHIKAGGKLTKKQKGKLSAPELAYVKAVELGEDPEIKEVVGKIGEAIDQGAQTLRKGLDRLFGEKD